jgi:hypothetical protein
VTVADKKKAAKKPAKKKSSANQSNLSYAEPNKIARQQSLPTMQDRAIKSLENRAYDYADVRDQRIGLSKREGELKQELLGLMKKHEKEEYHHGSVHITLVHEKENVRVKIKADGDEELSHEESEEDEEQDEPIEVEIQA